MEGWEEEYTPLRIDQLESRYRLENRIMDAVAKGQTETAVKLAELVVCRDVGELSAWNVLLRKAAEGQGVPLVALERVSSSFGERLQRSVPSYGMFLKEMVGKYSSLTQRADNKRYAPPVHRAMLYIDANLSNPLSLQVVAKALNISGSYLSGLFRKETGQTLTQYIHRQRILHAMELLETTSMQVQTIAQHCGYFDVHYFSKLFRRVTGRSPSGYRNSLGQ